MTRERTKGVAASGEGSCLLCGWVPPLCRYSFAWVTETPGERCEYEGCSACKRSNLCLAHSHAQWWWLLFLVVQIRHLPRPCRDGPAHMHPAVCMWREADCTCVGLRAQTCANRHLTLRTTSVLFSIQHSPLPGSLQLKAA